VIENLVISITGKRSLEITYKNYDRTVLDWIKEVLTEEPASRPWPEKGNRKACI